MRRGVQAIQVHSAILANDCEGATLKASYAVFWNYKGG